MCGRFVQQNTVEIPRRFGAVATPEAQLALTPRYNVAPTQSIPVVLTAEGGERRVELARWGLTPRHGANKDFTLFNARAETLLERASFRRLLPRQRCLVPADGFYDWEQVGNAKLPWLYRLKDGETFAFAGLYDRWQAPDGRDVKIGRIGPLVGDRGDGADASPDSLERRVQRAVPPRGGRQGGGSVRVAFGHGEGS